MRDGAENEPMLIVRPARPEEAAALTDVCLRSKAVWGYDAAFLDACRAELTLTPRMIETSDVMVADRDGAVAGVGQIEVSGEVGELTRLFVEPSSLGAGVGRVLFEWARTAATAAGARLLVIESDPGAADFYRRMGASDAGDVASGSIPGRKIPRLVLALA
jgi:GNAT superfamily N-acetyltransferase